jgi:hypothetical protein
MNFNKLYEEIMSDSVEDDMKKREQEVKDTTDFIFKEIKKNKNVVNATIVNSISDIKKLKLNPEKISGYIKREMGGLYEIDLYADIEFKGNEFGGVTWNHPDGIWQPVYKDKNNTVFFTTDIDSNEIARDLSDKLFGKVLSNVEKFRKKNFGSEPIKIKTARNA